MVYHWYLSFLLFLHLTLLCVDNQHFFLQHHAAIFVPLSGGKTDRLGHLPPQIHIESHSNVNLCPVFYLKAYLRLLNHLGRSQMDLE